MFYHVWIGISGLESWLEENNTKEDVLTNYICPFLNRDVTLTKKAIRNLSSLGLLNVFRTERPVDSTWPIIKKDFSQEFQYERAVRSALEDAGANVTGELVKEALVLTTSGKYADFRKKLLAEEKGRVSFFICPMDDAEVDHNYEFVIKPSVEKHQVDIARADEISHTATITDVIISRINRSAFVIADLTHERPNCYYEVGYAHAFAKPVIILAKEGTTRH